MKLPNDGVQGDEMVAVLTPSTTDANNDANKEETIENEENGEVKMNKPLTENVVT